MKAFDEYEMNEDYQYDIPVGETFVYKGKTLTVIPNNRTVNCDDCDFSPWKCGRFTCIGSARQDEQGVVFKEVE